MQKKVVNFTANSYQIKYKTFLFWHSIKAVSGVAELLRDKPWEFMCDDGGINTKLFFNHVEAVNFAKQFETIEDIEKYHEGLKSRLKEIKTRRKQITRDKKVNIKL